LLAVKQAEDWLGAEVKVHPLWQGVESTGRKKKSDKKKSFVRFPKKPKIEKPEIDEEKTPPPSVPMATVETDIKEVATSDTDDGEAKMKKDETSNGISPDKSSQSDTALVPSTQNISPNNDSKKRRGRPKVPERVLPEKEKFVLSLNKPKESKVVPTTTTTKTRGKKKQEQQCMICKVQTSEYWQGPEKNYICEKCIRKAIPLISSKD